MKNAMPQCNYCKETKQSEWEFIYGELPTHDYTYCCTEHITDMIKSISKGKNGEVRLGYLKKWNTGRYLTGIYLHVMCSLQKQGGQAHRRAGMCEAPSGGCD
jgi:hypothetical protein